MLEDSSFIESKPVSTPSDHAVKLHQDSSHPHSYIPAYRRLVGRLMYLNSIGSDIIFYTQQLDQILSTPTMSHFNVTCRLFKYLKICPSRGTLFPRDSTMQLNGYSNADWGGCLDIGRSTLSQCFFLWKSLVSWRTEKQLIVSRSSLEAE